MPIDPDRVQGGCRALPDAERHLREGAALARQIGRPYLEVGCLAQLGFASKIHSFANTQRRCREAIALGERHGWGTEPVIAPALVTLAGTMVWTGEFDEAERWLQRTAQVSTHIRSIYAKLQVSDRSSAVQRARELRLLAAAR